MSDYEKREGSGVLFKNKTDNPQAPAYKGDILLNGVLFELAAWVKEGKSGKFFSIVGKVKGAKYEAKAKPADDLENDLPFSGELR